MMNIKFCLKAFPKSRTVLLNGIRFFNEPKCETKHCNLLNSRNYSRRIPQLYLDIATRNYSTEPDKNKVPENIRLPPLMNFPRVMWPSIFKSFKNMILSFFIIKPYMDLDFDLHEFVMGSRKAVVMVSKKLSCGEDLDELVTDDIVPTLKSRLSIMSDTQKEWLAIDEEDIYFSFPYQVGIIFSDDEADQKRFVEILMVHHSLRGLGQMRMKGAEIPLNIGFQPEYRNKICIANYRFIREFTKGVKADWTINLLNHFKPADEDEEL